LAVFPFGLNIDAVACCVKEPDVNFAGFNFGALGESVSWCD